MSYISIIILAFVLSIDAFIVSFSYGLVFKEDKVKNSLNLALFTGGFQALMPVLGYFLTNSIKSYIISYASLIVFLIFTYLGIRFIIEAFQKEKEQTLCLSLKCLLLIGIATSIDAFSAGITLSLFGNRILKPVLLIGVVTFVDSILGFFIGNKIKHLPTKWIEILAGVLLILLGVKSFF